MDSAGKVYVADTFNDTIRQVTPVGTNWVVTTLAGRPDISGSANGVGNGAQFYYPTGVAVDTNGNVYVADYWNSTIRKLKFGEPGSAATTLAGVADSPGSTDGSPGQFYLPLGVALDSGQTSMWATHTTTPSGK